ncbi:MAG: hypothetical protein JRJ47_10685 [Deltaproteobacteria bacterium]|nr:hypothetical protein [Deltaproteobacteria bacterium]
MCPRNLYSGIANHLNLPHFFVVLCLVLILAVMFPSLCTAEYHKNNFPSQKVAVNETPGAISPATPPTQGQVRDPATLELLKARKSSLDQERSQIETELAGVIKSGLEQKGSSNRKTKRAMWKVNEDLEAMVKRLVAHHEKREKFERDWDEYYVALKDSPEVKSLEERERALDWDRTQIQEKITELVETQNQQITKKKAIQWYQVVLREIDERLGAFLKNRDALERDWEAFYSDK